MNGYSAYQAAKILQYLFVIHDKDDPEVPVKGVAFMII
jgi:hypothetical protein